MERGYLSHCFKSRTRDLGHAPLVRYDDVTNPKWRTAAILDFRKSDFWALGPLGLPIFYLGVKFGAKMLIDAEIIAQNRNPRWRPSAILDLLRHHIGPTTKFFHWAHRPVKFYANAMYSFEDMTIWNFCRFGLKCLFTPPQFWFFGLK